MWGGGMWEGVEGEGDRGEGKYLIGMPAAWQIEKTQSFTDLPSTESLKYKEMREVVTFKLCAVVNDSIKCKAMRKPSKLPVV